VDGSPVAAPSAPTGEQYFDDLDDAVLRGKIW
jgi:hypothetical protein